MLDKISDIEKNIESVVSRFNKIDENKKDQNRQIAEEYVILKYGGCIPELHEWIVPENLLTENIPMRINSQYENYKFERYMNQRKTIYHHHLENHGYILNLNH